MLSSFFDGRRHNRSRSAVWLCQIMFGAIVFLFSASAFSQQSVEQWKRFDISLPDTSWSGNAYDVVLTAEFTHVDSGEVKTQFGFYAGNETWKIYFMPNRTGNWTYATTCADSDLNDITGSFSATAPSISGHINPVNKHWRLSNGKVISPTILAVGPFVRSQTLSETQGLVDWASLVKPPKQGLVLRYSY